MIAHKVKKVIDCFYSQNFVSKLIYSTLSVDDANLYYQPQNGYKTPNICMQFTKKNCFCLAIKEDSVNVTSQKEQQCIASTNLKPEKTFSFFNWPEDTYTSIQLSFNQTLYLREIYVFADSFEIFILSLWENFHEEIYWKPDVLNTI